MADPNSTKLFQFNQKYGQMIGIELSQPSKNRYAFNSTQLFLLISSTQFAMALLAFLVYDAETMAEYGITFVALITIIQAMVTYLNNISKLEYTLKFIENCQHFIENRKWVRVHLFPINK